MRVAGLGRCRGEAECVPLIDFVSRSACLLARTLMFDAVLESGMYNLLWHSGKRITRYEDLQFMGGASSIMRAKSKDSVKKSGTGYYTGILKES